MITSAETIRDILAKLPPNDRDFDIFERVVVGGGSTRAAAATFKLSQTRVCQVLERVRAWLEEVLPAAAEKTTAQQLDLAERLAADRLDHLFGRAMEAWRNSAGEVERVRTTATGDRVTTHSTSNGDARYLTAAARLAMLRSKLGTSGVLTAAMALAADAEDAQALVAEQGLTSVDRGSPAAPHSHPETSTNPPVRACSASAPLAVKEEPSGAAVGSITFSPTGIYSNTTPRQQAARRAFFGTVQPTEPGAPLGGTSSLPARAGGRT